MLRRMGLSFLVASMTLVGLMFSHPLPAQAACTTSSGSFDISPLTTPVFSANTGDVIALTMSHPGTQMSAELQEGPGFLTTVAQVFNSPNSLTLTYTVPASNTYRFFLSDNEGLPTGTTFYTIKVGTCSAGGKIVCFTDARVNRNCAAPVAVYVKSTDEGWALTVLKIVDSKGYDFIELDNNKLGNNKKFSSKGLSLSIDADDRATLTYPRDNGKLYFLIFTLPSGALIAEGEIE